MLCVISVTKSDVMKNNNWCRIYQVYHKLELGSMSGIDSFRVMKVLRFRGIKVFASHKLSSTREGGRKGMSGMGN